MELGTAGFTRVLRWTIHFGIVRESKLSAIPCVLWFVTDFFSVTAKVVVGDRPVVRTISNLERTADTYSMLSQSIHLLPNDATTCSTSFHAPPAIPSSLLYLRDFVFISALQFALNHNTPNHN